MGREERPTWLPSFCHKKCLNYNELSLIEAINEVTSEVCCDKPECKYLPMDLMILMDGSESITDLKQWTTGMIDTVLPNPENMTDPLNLQIVQFANQVRTEVDTYICNNPGNETVVVSNFPDDESPSNLPSILPLPSYGLASCKSYSRAKEDIQGISQYESQGTDLWRALELADKEMELKVTRPTTKVMITITDGAYAEMTDENRKLLNQLKFKFDHMLAVGVGEMSEKEYMQLQDLTKDSEVISVKDYTSLNENFKNILMTVCETHDPEEIVEPTNSPTTKPPRGDNRRRRRKRNGKKVMTS